MNSRMKGASVPAHPDLEIIAMNFGRREWIFDILSDTAISLTLCLPSGKFSCVARVLQGGFSFQSSFPLPVPEAKRKLMEEFISRANYQALSSEELSGVLYLDYEKGIVKVVTMSAVAAGYLCMAMVDQVVDANLRAAERCLSGVAGVCYLDISPKAAVEKYCVSCSITAAVEKAAEDLESGRSDRDDADDSNLDMD